MSIQDLQSLYSHHPRTAQLLAALKTSRQQHILLQGLNASARALVINEMVRRTQRTTLIILSSSEEAEYMYSDLRSLNGIQEDQECNIKLFPSSYRKRQTTKEEAYEIQRTEVLGWLSQRTDPLTIISFPEAIAEPIQAKDTLEKHLITLEKNQHIPQSELIAQLIDEGFERVDFVYEPGQFSQRGGIIDIFSYSHELPYRLDFFGDDIDSIRIFDLETQLSKEQVEKAQIVNANPAKQEQTEHTSILTYLSDDTIILTDDMNTLKYKVESTLEDTRVVLTPVFEGQYTTIELSSRSFFRSFTPIEYHTTPQPLFHKNFDLMADAIHEYQSAGYKIYICSDSKKQTDRIEAILDEKNLTNAFIPLQPTLHEGFVDKDAEMVVLTDHQLFERYHRVGQGAKQVRRSKALITLKELNQLQVGDYVVHIDHGIGKFGGLVRSTVNGKPQEMIKLIYRNQDVLFVSIHNLHRISKYKGKEGSEPQIAKLGSGQWERTQARTKQRIKDIARDLIRLYAARRAENGYQYSPDTYLQHALEASFLYEDTPDQQKATIDVKHDMESAVPMDRLICGDVGFGKTEIAMRAAFKAATDSKQVAVLVPTTVLALQHYNTFSERFRDFPVRVEYLSRGKSAKETKQILDDLAEGKIDVIIGTHKLVGKQVRFKDLGLLIIDEEQKFGVATKEKLRQMRVNIDTLTLTATPIPRTLQFSLLGARDLSIMTTPPPNRYPIQTEVITPDDEDIIAEAINLEIDRNGQVFVINNLVQTLPAVERKIRRLCPEARIAVAHGQMPTEQMEQVLTDFINYEYDVLVATSIIESGVDIPNVNTIIINAANRFGLSDLHQLRGRVGRSNRKAYCYLVAPASELLTPEAKRRLQAVETFAELGSGFHIAMQDLDIRGAGNMLGAEQSGFIAELGYETYQRILSEAMLELREEEHLNTDTSPHPELVSGSLTNTGELVSGSSFNTGASLDGINTQQWVTDSQLETDLELSFPSDYIENISERIALYRELDSLQREQDLLDFQKRLIDRFGAMPTEAQELIEVVRLRWLCIEMGIEKVVLKQSRMVLYFPHNEQSPYYQSDIFGKIINYAVTRPQRCRLREVNGKRSVVIEQVNTLKGAMNLLNKIKQEQ